MVWILIGLTFIGPDILMGAQHIENIVSKHPKTFITIEENK